MESPEKRARPVGVSTLCSMLTMMKSPKKRTDPITGHATALDSENEEESEVEEMSDDAESLSDRESESDSENEEDSDAEETPDDTASDRADLQIEQARGSSSHGVVKPMPGATRASAKSGDFLAMSTQEWDIKQAGNDSQFGLMMNKTDGRKYTVHRNRIGKAMVHLKQDSFLTPLQTKSCECRRNCNTKCTPDEIRGIREELFRRHDSEEDVMEHLMTLLRTHKGKLKVNGETVCRKFYAASLGVGVNKVKNAKLMLQGPGKDLAGGRINRKKRKRRSMWDNPDSKVQSWHVSSERLYLFFSRVRS